MNGSVTDFLVTNKFNRFFCEIGSKLANNIESTSTQDSLKFLTNRVSISIFFNDPSHNEILDTIMSLKGKAMTIWQYSTFFSKSCSACHHSISPYPHSIQFQSCIFSNNCKIAHVVQGNREDATNYRPISIITCFSKLFEKLIHLSQTKQLFSETLNYPSKSIWISKKKFLPLTLRLT